METKELKISAIKPNPSNPRVIKDYKFHKLVKSLLVLPQMMELRPIVVNNENVVLGGNMRFKALQHIASLTEAVRMKIMQSADNYNQKSDEEKVQICEFWHKFSASKSILVNIADSLTDAEQREFIVKDNAAFGEWDWEELANQYDAEELQDYGIDMPDYSVEDMEEPTDLDGEDKNKPFAIKITFESDEKLNEFRDKYEKIIQDEFKVIISVSGGEL